MQRSKAGSLFPGAARGPTGVIKSVLDTSRTNGGRRDEIFVDIVEKVSCTFNASGYIQNSQIDGAIQVITPPSFLFHTVDAHHAKQAAPLRLSLAG